MTRMDKPSEHGPGWTDVREMMKEVGGAHDKRIDIHCSAAMGVNRAESLVWNVRAWQWGKWGEGTPYHYTSAVYPSSQWKTVPAMLYNLLHRLDSELTSMEEEKRARRPLRLPGL